MGRKVQQNKITSPEKLAAVNQKNMELKRDFLAYLRSIQRSPNTIKGYDNDLDIIMVFLLERCGNKEFVSVKKREWVAMQDWMVNENGNSAARVRRIKAVISSLSNYVSNILAEDEPDEFGSFKPTIRGIENPVNTPVMEKTVLSDEEVNTVLSALMDAKQYEKACYFALAAFSGRRKSELFRFKVEHFSSDHLICNGALYSTLETIQSKGRGVTGKQIVFYTLAKDFQPYFDAWMRYREQIGLDSPWMFPDPDDPMQPRDPNIANSWTNTFSRVLFENTGRADKIYSHALRHYYTTRLSKSGVPHNVIKEIVAWEDVSMVARYDDTDVVESFSDYFTADGIKGAEKKSLSDL